MENKKKLLDLFIDYKNHYTNLLNDISTNSSNLIIFQFAKSKIERKIEIIDPKYDSSWKESLLEYELEEIDDYGFQYFLDKRKKEREENLKNIYSELSEEHTLFYSFDFDENFKYNVKYNEILLNYINEEPLLIKSNNNDYYEYILMNKEFDKTLNEYRYYEYTINTNKNNSFINNLSIDLDQIDLLFDYEKKEISLGEFDFKINSIANELTINNFKEQNLLLSIVDNDIKLYFTNEYKDYIDSFVLKTLYDKYINFIEEFRISNYKDVDKNEFKEYFLSNKNTFKSVFQNKTMNNDENDLNIMFDGLIYAIKSTLIDFSKNKTFKEFAISLNDIKNNKQSFFENNKDIIIKKLYEFLDSKKVLFSNVKMLKEIDDKNCINQEEYLSIFNRSLNLLKGTDLPDEKKQYKLYSIVNNEINKKIQQKGLIEKTEKVHNFLSNVKECYHNYKKDPINNKFEIVKAFTISNYFKMSNISSLFSKDNVLLFEKNVFNVIKGDLKFVIDIGNEILTKHKYSDKESKQKEYDNKEKEESELNMLQRQMLKQQLMEENPNFTKEEIQKKVNEITPRLSNTISIDDFIDAFKLKKVNLENTKLFSLIKLMETKPIILLESLEKMKENLKINLIEKNVNILEIKENITNIELFIKIQNNIMDNLKEPFKLMINNLNDKNEVNTLNNEEISSLDYNINKIKELNNIELILIKYFYKFIENETYKNDLNYLNVIFKENDLTSYEKKIITDVFSNYFYNSLNKSLNALSNYSQLELIGKDVLFDQYTLAKLLVIVGSESAEDILEIEEEQFKKTLINNGLYIDDNINEEEQTKKILIENGLIKQEEIKDSEIKIQKEHKINEDIFDINNIFDSLLVKQEEKIEPKINNIEDDDETSEISSF